MDTASFERQLKADGFQEIETKKLDPRPANGDHGHHFTVRGLVLAGEFTVNQETSQRCYRPGEVFEVAEGCLHHEIVGPEGAEVIVGRRF